MKTVVSCFLAILVITITCLPASAEKKEANLLDQLKWVKGPATAQLDKWGSIELTDEFMFLNGDDTRIIMSAFGNFCSGQEVGFMSTTNFFNTNDTASAKWFVVFRFDDCGYIKDDEKKDLNADAILQNYKDGNEEANKERRKRGDICMTIIGWDIPPRYNETTHNLEWCLRAKDDRGDLVINQNTRLLGRRGVMMLTLVADPNQMPIIMPEFNNRIASFQFNTGEKYSEYRQGDKIAKYGLAALVAGGAMAAAVKTGLLQKLMKPILVGLVAIGVFFKNIFGKFLGGKKE